MHENIGPVWIESILVSSTFFTDFSFKFNPKHTPTYQSSNLYISFTINVVSSFIPYAIFDLFHNFNSNNSSRQLIILSKQILVTHSNFELIFLSFRSSSLNGKNDTLKKGSWSSGYIILSKPNNLMVALINVVI